MTTTTILSAVSAGTSTNVGDKFNPVVTALQAATTAVLVSVQVTLTTLADVTAKIRVRQAVSPNSHTAAVGPQVMQQASEYVDLFLLSGTNSFLLERSSGILVTAAGYHYCWVEMPKLTAACTLTVKLQEIP